MQRAPAHGPINTTMKTNTLTKLAVGLALGLQMPATAGPDAVAAPTSNGGDWCSLLQSKPKLYQNKKNPYIQEIGIEGRAQWQTAHIDVNGIGDEDSDTFTEWRRVRLGTKVKFLNYFSAKYQVNVVSDGRPSGNDLQWGYDSIDEAYVEFDLGKALGDNYFDSISLKYGMHKYLLGQEATESSKNILTPERSAISNKVYQSGRLTGLMGYAEKNDWTFGAGIYSSSQHGASNQEFSGWQDGIVYWLHAAYKASDNLTLAADFAYNDVDRLGGDDDALGYDWAASISAVYENGRFGTITDFIFGDNGDQTNTDREGNFYGIVVMPYYWIVEDKLQAVVQLQHMASNDPEGVRFNSRYGGRNHNATVNSGRGDSHQSIYTGLNYYLCDHNAKIMAGMEYQQLDAPGPEDVESLTWILAVRTCF